MATMWAVVRSIPCLAILANHCATSRVPSLVTALVSLTLEYLMRPGSW